MSATIGRVQGFRKDGSPQASEGTRLGAGGVGTRACTWRTFAIAHVNDDGSGYVRVRRDDKTLHRFDFDAEGGIE